MCIKSISLNVDERKVATYSEFTQVTLHWVVVRDGHLMTSLVAVMGAVIGDADLREEIDGVITTGKMAVLKMNNHIKDIQRRAEDLLKPRHAMLDVQH